MESNIELSMLQLMIVNAKRMNRKPIAVVVNYNLYNNTEYWKDKEE